MAYKRLNAYAVGTYDGFQLGAGDDKVSAVKDNNGDASYIRANTAGAKQSYIPETWMTTEKLREVGRLKKVRVVGVVRDESVAQASYFNLFLKGSSEVKQEFYCPETSYRVFVAEFGKDVEGDVWDWEDLEGVEFGIEFVSGGAIRCTELYLELEYDPNFVKFDEIDWIKNGEDVTESVLNRPVQRIQLNVESVRDEVSKRMDVVESSLKDYFSATFQEAVIIKDANFTIGATGHLEMSSGMQVLYKGEIYSLGIGADRTVRRYLYAVLDFKDKSGFVQMYDNLQNDTNRYHFVLIGEYSNGVIVRKRELVGDLGALDVRGVRLIKEFETEGYNRLRYAFEQLLKFIGLLFEPGIVPIARETGNENVNCKLYTKNGDRELWVSSGYVVFPNGGFYYVEEQMIDTSGLATGNHDIYISFDGFRIRFTTGDTGNSVYLGRIEKQGNTIEVLNDGRRFATMKVWAGLKFMGTHKVTQIPDKGELRYSEGYLAYATEASNDSWRLISTANESFPNVIVFGSAGSTSSFDLKCNGVKWVPVPAGRIVKIYVFEGGSGVWDYADKDIAFGDGSLIGVRVAVSGRVARIILQVMNGGNITEYEVYTIDGYEGGAMQVSVFGVFRIVQVNLS